MQKGKTTSRKTSIRQVEGTIRAFKRRGIRTAIIGQILGLLRGHV